MALFDAFDDRWILHRDEERLVVHKPAGVPCQSPDGAGDDLPSRLKRHLGLDYLGAHQRLDAATSGVIAYALTKSANAALASALRDGDKDYLAVVSGFKGAMGSEQTLEHWLAPRKGGGSQVSSESDKRAKHAISDVKVLRRNGKRSLLQVRIRTGRTHQIRVQLAAVGAPVIGDASYGGQPGARLMLHAHRLRLGDWSHVSAPPPELEQALRSRAPYDIESRMRAAAHRRYGLWHDPTTTAFRLLNGDAEGMPGASVDVYGKHLVLHLHSDEAQDQEEELVQGLRAFEDEFEGLYIKRRPRRANDLSARDTTELAPPDPLWGRPLVGGVVLENGMKMRVELGGAMSTGVFLDQRHARQKVRDGSEGLRVLNLFSYTCPFGLAAALGGASEVINVDASGAALGVGKENFALNEVEGRFLRADAFEYLARTIRKGEHFDLVVCDPPTYATSKKKRWKSGGQWTDLAAQCASVTARRGQMLLCSNDSRMPQARFRKYVRDGIEKAGRRAVHLRDGRAARDFPVSFGGESLPHRLWITLD